MPIPPVSPAELRSARADLIDQAAALVETAEAEQRDLTPEEQATYDRHIAEARNLLVRIQRLESLNDLRADLGRPQERVSAPLAARIEVVRDHNDTRTLGENLECIFNLLTSSSHEAVNRATEIIDKKYGGLRRFNGEGRAVQAQVGSTGGFLLASDLAESLFHIEAEGPVALNSVRKIPMQDDTLDHQELVQTKHPIGRRTSALFGGVSSYYVSEGVPVTQTEPKYENITLKVRELVTETEVSNRMFAKIPNYDAEIRRNMQGAIAFGSDFDCLFGNGVVEPLGMCTYGTAQNPGNPALIKVNRETANKFTFLDASRMVAASVITPAPQIFVMSRTVMPEIATMAMSGHPVFISQERGATQKISGNLLGIPIVFTEKAPPLGTPGDVTLITPSFYLWGYRPEVSIQVSEHAAIRQRRTLFQIVTFQDGQPGLKGTIKLSEGKTSGNTAVSPFVALGPTA